LWEELAREIKSPRPPVHIRPNPVPAMDRQLFIVVVDYCCRRGDSVPTVNLYLSEGEYVKLANLALKRRLKVTALARRAVQEFLERHEGAGM